MCQHIHMTLGFGNESVVGAKLKPKETLTISCTHFLVEFFNRKAFSRNIFIKNSGTIDILYIRIW